MPASKFALLLALVVSLAACDPSTDLVTDETGFAATASTEADQRTAQVDNLTQEDSYEAVRYGSNPELASCPCFSRGSLTNADQALAAQQSSSDYYLFFDTFNYFGLDPRRTEARAVVSTPAGPMEEVAAVYITYGSSASDLNLICYRQEIVSDPVDGTPYYAYETLTPTVAEAEACRQNIYGAVGGSETCQGPACGLPYSREQLDPNYPGYDDGNRATEPLHASIRRAITEVTNALAVPARTYERVLPPSLR